MGDDKSDVTFNIGSQSGAIENIGRDKVVHGDQKQAYFAGSADELRDELAKLREAIAALGLPTDAAAEAGGLIDEADIELAQPQPDPTKVAGPLERLTNLVTDAGALASAGAAVIDPLQRIGSWLGAAGSTLLQLLH